MSNNPRLRNLNLKRPPEVAGEEEPIDATEYVMLVGKEEVEDDHKAHLKDIWAVTQDIVVNKSIGQYSDGDTITAGTRLSSILQKILVDRIVPDYTDPSVQLRATNNTTVEVGDTITPTFEARWDQNDAGSLTDALIESGAETVSDFTLEDGVWVSPITGFNDHRMEDVNKSYVLTASYEEGPLKTDNFGDPAPGQIQAGSVSDGAAYNPARPFFFQFSESDTVLDDPLTASDDHIRNTITQDKRLSYTINNYEFNIPANTKSIAFAYPASIGDLSAIIYVENSNSNELGTFTKEEYQVAGLGGDSFLPIAYNVYVWNGDAPFSSSVTYKLEL